MTTAVAERNGRVSEAMEMPQLAPTEPAPTLNDLVRSVDALNSLLQKPLPARTAFKLAKVVRLIEPELQQFNETRKALFERHGTLNEEGNGYSFEPEQGRQVDAELQSIMTVEVPLPCAAISIDELGAVEVTAAEMMALSWLFKD